MGALADVEAVLNAVSDSLQFHCFCHEEVGSNDTSISDDVDFPFIEDSRRNAAKHEFLSFKYDCMASIGATCKAGYYIVTRSKYVYYFAFAFISEDDTQKGIHFSFVHYCILFCFFYTCIVSLWFGV